MKPQMPTVENVVELPALITRSIPPEWEDHNGHVNIQHYMELYCQAGCPMMAQIGLDENYFKNRRCGFFDLEHHLFYLAEIHVEDHVSVHSRLLGTSPKRFHGMMFVVNQSRQLLASTLEFITSGADLTTRRTAIYPDDVACVLGNLVSKHARLTWPAPACGVMSP